MTKTQVEVITSVQRRRRRTSVTLACRFVAVGAVFGVNRLPPAFMILGATSCAATSAAVKPRLIAVASSPNSPKTCAVVFSGRHGSATERLSDGATGPTGLCALRAHHTRLIKTGDYQARSFTALEAAM